MCSGTHLILLAPICPLLGGSWSSSCTAHFLEADSSPCFSLLRHLLIPREPADRPLFWLCLKSPELVLLMTFRPQERLGHVALMVFPSSTAFSSWLWGHELPLASAAVAATVNFSEAVALIGPSSQHLKEGGPTAGTALGFQKAFPMSAYPAESPKYSSQGMESRGLSKLSHPRSLGRE